MKKLLLILLAMTIVLSVTACSVNTDTGDSAPAAEPSGNASVSTESARESVPEVKPTEGRKLTIMAGSGDGGGSAMKAALDKGGEIVGAEIVYSIFPEDQFFNVAKTKLATGNADDIVFHPWSLPDTPYQEFAPLDGEWASKISEATRPFCVSPEDGKTILMAPFGPEGNMGMAYNKAVLETAGVTLPLKNYSEFIAACDKIKATGITPVFISNKENWTAQILLLTTQTTAIMNYPPLEDQLITNQVKPKDILTIKTLWDNVAALKNLGYINEDFMSATHNMGKTALAEGTVGFYCVTDGSYGEIMAEYPDKLEGIGMTVTPLWNDAKDEFVMTNRSNRCLSVVASGKNVVLAKQFVDACLTEPVMSAYYELNPGPAPYKDLGYELPMSAWNKELSGMGLPAHGDFMNALYNGQPKLNALFGDFNLQIQSIFAGKTTDEALDAWYLRYCEDMKARRVEGF